MGRRFIFRQKNILSNELREGRDVCVQRPRFLLTQITPKVQSNFREIREIITQCILFGRCTQTSLPLITHYSKSAVICRICFIRMPLKILYKNAVLYKSSQKVENAQLEKYYFPTGKLFFLSWKVKNFQQGIMGRTFRFVFELF